MNELKIMFQPKSINSILKFFRNTKPGCSYNLAEHELIEYKDIEESFEESMMKYESSLLSH
jgi:hypothetical protein